MMAARTHLPAQLSTPSIRTLRSGPLMIVAKITAAAPTSTSTSSAHPARSTMRSSPTVQTSQPSGMGTCVLKIALRTVPHSTRFFLTAPMLKTSSSGVLEMANLPAPFVRVHQSSVCQTQGSSLSVSPSAQRSSSSVTPANESTQCARRHTLSKTHSHPNPPRPLRAGVLLPDPPTESHAQKEHLDPRNSSAALQTAVDSLPTLLAAA